MIYILHPVEGGPFKIGTSVNPRGRKAQIASLFPYSVEVLATFDGGRREEHFLHWCFRPIACGQEWFRPSPSIWAFVLDVLEVGRPAFIPCGEPMSKQECRSLAIHLFGNERSAMEALGYSRFTPVQQTFAVNSALNASLWARLQFAKAQMEGVLPAYIDRLHDRRPSVSEAA